MRTVITGGGTGETAWRPWLDEESWAPLDLEWLTKHRVVVIAAHPDDEVLGVGGLMRQLAAHEVDLVCVWATDGEASHPRSRVFTSRALATARREESRVALDRLGVTPYRGIHLGLPDSEVGRSYDELVRALRRIVTRDDVVIAPWRGDGHPDHEAVGLAAAQLDLPLIEYPIWMWHWASPADRRVPWHRTKSVDAIDLAAKTAAIDAFATQVRPIGPAAADAAILSPGVLDRFRRPCELVFQ